MCMGARFRRDSAGRSLEVDHGRRPPTPFHAQNRQFQPLQITANDTWEVRALLRRLIPSFAKTPRFTRGSGVFALLEEARSGRIPQGSRRRYAPDAVCSDRGTSAYVEYPRTRRSRSPVPSRRRRQYIEAVDASGESALAPPL
jgi:hypothetical protein